MYIGRTLRSSVRKGRRLEDFGYHFKKGKLENIETGDPFEFEVKKGDKAYNQKRYEALGEAITEHVFELLETEGELEKIRVPKDAKKGEPTGFFFASKNAWKKDTLLVLIHGSGVVRAGQWSRKLIINEGLERGTQLPYIRKGKDRKFGIVVLNTNYNVATSAEGRPEEYIRRNHDGVAHSLYVWQEFIRPAKAKNIAIVAHSAGGYHTVKLAGVETEDFKKRVFAVCFTDSAHTFARNEGWDFLKKVGRNWVTSEEPLDTELSIGGRDIDRVSAGVMKHEETSPAAIEAVFKFIERRRKELNSKAKRSNDEHPETSGTATPHPPKAKKEL